MDKKALVEEYTEWLERFAWVWFATLTFRGFPSVRRANRLFADWIEDLRATQGTTEFGWFAVSELGRTGQDFHFHVLIAGLEQYHAEQRMDFMRRWADMAGDARIDLYRKGKGGIPYVLKNFDPNRPEQIGFDLDGSTQERAKVGAE